MVWQFALVLMLKAMGLVGTAQGWGLPSIAL
ncbi:MAG: hypothetical protein QOF73_2814, partial [Thermomicrobiales bacterium]|nr:hypothetical protein [Thermomicrobiales bacterium]